MRRCHDLATNLLGDPVHEHTAGMRRPWIEMVVLCMQAHLVRLQLGDTPVEQTNLLLNERVSDSMVP